MGDKGENLSFSTYKYNNTVKIRNAMKRYYDEKNHYTYNDQNRCAHYRACHYTQVKHVKLLVTIIRTCVAITELVITHR
jgi:hypothetical protein